MKIIKRILAFIVLLILAVFLFFNFANFSSGFRAGVPIKVSKKGILFKTWEGELNVGGLANSAEGAIPATWAFSIAADDEQVREKLEEAATYGKRVKLKYNEKFVKFFWKGDTKYFVYEVEVLN
ncbi:MAG: hypothetical protein RIC80_13470 [Cyclobacteriaceae bacterium]